MFLKNYSFSVPIVGCPQPWAGGRGRYAHLTHMKWLQTKHERTGQEIDIILETRSPLDFRGERDKG